MLRSDCWHRKKWKQREHGDLGGLVQGATGGKQLASSDDPRTFWRGVRLHADAQGGAGTGSSSAQKTFVFNLSRLLHWKRSGFAYLWQQVQCGTHPTFFDVWERSSQRIWYVYFSCVSIYFMCFFQSETSARTSARVSPITSAFVSQVKIQSCHVVKISKECLYGIKTLALWLIFGDFFDTRFMDPVHLRLVWLDSSLNVNAETESGTPFSARQILEKQNNAL